MILRRGGGLIQSDAEREPGNRLCQVCAGSKDVQFLRFTSPSRAARPAIGGPGQVFVRCCSECLTDFATAILREAENGAKIGPA